MILRGEIYQAALDPVLGSEQGGTRPVLIVQNNLGNRYSPTVIALAMTSRTGKARLPTHIEIAQGTAGLPRDSVVLAEQGTGKPGTVHEPWDESGRIISKTSKEDTEIGKTSEFAAN